MNIQTGDRDLWPIRSRRAPWADGLPPKRTRAVAEVSHPPLGRVGLCWIPVRDMDTALAFWTATMGLVVTVERTTDADGRRIELAIPGADTGIGLLETPDAPHVAHGCRTSFECDDVQKTYRDLTGRGVEFLEPPRCDARGGHAKFLDPDGNTFALTSPPQLD